MKYILIFTTLFLFSCSKEVSYKIGACYFFLNQSFKLVAKGDGKLYFTDSDEVYTFKESAVDEDRVIEIACDTVGTIEKYIDPVKTLKVDNR